MTHRFGRNQRAATWVVVALAVIGLGLVSLVQVSSVHADDPSQSVAPTSEPFPNVLGLPQESAAALQAEIDEYLASTPGTRQVSQYEVSLTPTDGFMTWPDPRTGFVPPESPAVQELSGVPAQ